MVSKLVILFFVFYANFSYSDVIYDKNNITITNIELNKFINIYENNTGSTISKNKAIKNFVLIKKTINYLLKNNPNFVSILDKRISLEFGKEIFGDQVLLNFLRFQKTRNEFISEYFQNNFTINDLELLFSNFNDLKLPISKNNCLTIEKLHNVNSDKYFIKSFFENLKSNKKEFVTLIDNNLFSVCINNELFQKIEYEIVKYIETKTSKDFDNFIYGKTNWKKNTFL